MEFKSGEKIMSRYTDFTDGWVETDASNRLTVTTSKCSVADMNPDDDNTHLSYDGGTDFFKDHLCHSFEVFIQSTPDNTSSIHLWSLANTLDDLDGAESSEGDLPTFYAFRAGGDIIFRLRYYDMTGDTYFVSTAGIDLNTIYYVDIIRNGTSVKAYIYTNVAKTDADLFEVLSITANATEYQYLFLCQSAGVGQPAAMSGYVQNFQGKIEGCPYITIFGDTKAVDLRMPENISYIDSKGIQQFHFFSEGNAVFDIGKEAETITLSGYETSAVSDTFRILDEIVDNDEEVTLDGFDIDELDTTWVVADYNYSVKGRMDDECKWSITLEKT